MTDPITTVWADRPAGPWLDAAPLGNGRLGAMVFGRVYKETIGLNEETLWTRQAPGRLNPDALDHLEEVRRLLREGRPLDAQFLAEYSQFGRPHYQATYQTLGTLKILTQRHHEEWMTDYRRETDLRSGLVTVSYTIGDVRHTREIFASAPDDVIVMRISSSDDQPRDTAINLFRKQDAIGTTDGDDTLHLVGQCGSRGTKFASALTVLPGDGTVEAVGDHLHVRDAGPTTLVFAAASDFRHADPLSVVHDTIDQAVRRGFDAIRDAHVTEHTEKMDRVRIRLGTASPAVQDVPTAVRLQRLRDGGNDPELLATFFQFGRYLLLGSSRPGTLPANLQGIWNDAYIPGWDSKYTININTQMNYWPAEVAGLPECHEPLFDLLDRVCESGQRTARVHYGCDGFVAHHNVDIWADTAPLDNVNCGLWPLGGAWLALHLWEQFEHSGDLGFLERRAYPVLLEAATFLLDFMFEDETGTLQIGPTISPENAYAHEGVRVAVCLSSAMDVQLTRSTFDRVLRSAELLGIDDDPRLDAMRAALPKLPPHRIGDHGRLLEWQDDLEEWEPGHRHVSHLFGVFPDDQLLTDGDPSLVEASKRALEHRLDNSGLTSTDRSGALRFTAGWTWAWSAALWARLDKPDEAAECLRQALIMNTTDSLLITSPPGGTNPLTVFQIDGNLGSVAAIAEMVVQSHSGVVELLPAIPEVWPTGAVDGLRLRGGFVADVEWAEGSLVTASLTATRAAELRLTASQPLVVRGDGFDEHVAAGDVLTVPMTADQTLTVTSDETRTQP